MSEATPQTWTLADIRALGFYHDKVFTDGTVTVEERRGRSFLRTPHSFSDTPRSWRLGGPCVVCGLVTGAPEPCGYFCYRVSRMYCSSRCAQRAYRKRKRQFSPLLKRNCNKCGGAIPETCRTDAKFCSSRCRQASYRRALQLGVALASEPSTAVTGATP